jgi:proteic killer suppression protein
VRIATCRNLTSRVSKNSTRTQEIRSRLCAINPDTAKHGPQTLVSFSSSDESVRTSRSIRLHARCERSDFVQLIQSARRIARVGEEHRFARHALGSIEHAFDALASFSLVDCPKHIWTGNEPVTCPRDSVLPYYVNVYLIPKLRRLLTALDVATVAQDMDAPGNKLHRLEGELAHHWAVSVSGNWRLAFSFDGEDVIFVDHQDYH